MAKQYVMSQVPTLRRKRSRFDLSANVKTAINVGDLVPFYCQEVIPGDSMKIDSTCVSRLTSSFFKPIMDNLFLDVYFFYVPSRILYDKFVNIFGENTQSAWANQTEPTVPMLSNQTVSEGTVADYLGLPIGKLGIKDEVSILPFRAFALIYNEFFRDQNNVQPMHIQRGALSSSEELNNLPWSPANYTGKLPKVSKMHDYFTSCLPAPQKGNAVDVALSGYLPVYPRADEVPVEFLENEPTRLYAMDGSPFVSGSHGLAMDVVNSGSLGGTLSAKQAGDPATGNTSVNFSNLWADLNGATPWTVNDLRLAFQTQRMLERDARSGSRYTEYLQSAFGVSSGDARLQRPEFLGGHRSPISITQVTQTAPQSGESTPLADVAGYSHSMSRARANKGFGEHGYVIGVCCIRQFHSYSQGIQRFWSRSKRTDFYDPVFANIGEQPVYRRELFAGADGVFGYNEAWADMRQRPSVITGQMRPKATNSLALWHLGDNYANAPSLSQGFIEETPDYVNRAITVQSDKQAQFILDFYVQNIAIRELPIYSVPGLIDHN
nr:MAG TPA: Major capsid protein [Microviridae sp.]